MWLFQGQRFHGVNMFQGVGGLENNRVFFPSSQGTQGETGFWIYFPPSSGKGWDPLIFKTPNLVGTNLGVRNLFVTLVCGKFLRGIWTSPGNFGVLGELPL